MLAVGNSLDLFPLLPGAELLASPGFLGPITPAPRSVDAVDTQAGRGKIGFPKCPAKELAASS